jgi:hypothetical protein
MRFFYDWTVRIKKKSSWGATNYEISHLFIVAWRKRDSDEGWGKIYGTTRRWRRIEINEKLKRRREASTKKGSHHKQVKHPRPHCKHLINFHSQCTLCILSKKARQRVVPDAIKALFSFHSLSQSILWKTQHEINLKANQRAINLHMMPRWQYLSQSFLQKRGENEFMRWNIDWERVMP